MRDLILNKLQLKLHLEAHDWLLAEEAYAPDISRSSLGKCYWSALGSLPKARQCHLLGTRVLLGADVL
jgi:hypothetical protein